MSSAVNVAATASSAAAIPAPGAAAKAPSGGTDEVMASAAAFRQWNEGKSIRMNNLRRRMRHHLAGPDERDLGVNGTRVAAKTSGRDGGVFLAGDNPATSGKGNGDGAESDVVGNSGPRLVGLIKGGEGGSDVETVDSLTVGRRRSFPSLAAASTVAGLEREAGNGSIREFVGDVAIFERSRVRRGARSRRKLADWVKGSGLDDSDGDTNLSGASSKPSMILSPAEISPLKPSGYRPRRAEHGGRAASLRHNTAPHSPTKRTLRRRRSSRPPSARQSAGQETGSFDAAGEAAAAAAAAAGGSGAEEEEVERALEVGRRGATEKGTEDKGGAGGGGGGSSMPKERGAMKGAAAEARPAWRRGVPKAVALASGDGAVRARDQGEYPPRYDGKNERKGTGAREHESDGMVEGYQGAETPMASRGDEAAACAVAAPPTAAAAVAALPYEEEEQDGKSTPGGSTSASVVTSVIDRDGVTEVEAGAGRAGADSGDSFRDTAQQHQQQRHRGEPAPTTSSSHSLPPPVLVGTHGDSSGSGRVASFPLTGGKIDRSRRGTSSGGSASGSGVIGVESGGTDGGGGNGSGGVGTGSGRRWRGERILTPGNLRTRRSLSSGGSKLVGRSTTKKVLKEARERCLSDGEDVEELSPIGREIAYIKEQRGSASKSDKGAGGLGLGAWPNMTKKETDAAKVIYLGDIEFDAPGEATATDILVRQHRTRVRVKRVKDKNKAKIKRKAKTKEQRRRIRSGKPLHPEEDEVEYILTIGMMLGLRVAVGRQANPLVKPDLTVEDFYQVDKYTFPPSGATGYLVTPSHKLGQTFKFKDYAPKVFKKIREHFGVDKMRYMLSVAGNYNFLEFISNAKSGEFFFFSHDERFMIKTMKSSETKFLRKILPHYYEHVKVHPETFLVRFYGMYRVKMHHINRKVHFIVMNSMLDTYKEIHRTFDLKGSSLGRSAKPGEKVMKDNDLAEKQGKLHLGSQREVFLKVVRADSQFLSRMKIMDYSLLTGIHDRAKPSEDDQPQTPRRYSKFFTFADEAENRDTPGFKRVPPLAGGDKKPSTERSSRTVRLTNAEEPSGDDDSSTSNNQSRRSAGTLESVSGLRAGKGDTVSAVDSPGEDEGLDVGVVGSDEDPTSGGNWSATGTGTEEDTGGDNTEGDGEYETPAETAGGPQHGQSLSRCSTAQGNLAQWHPSELPPKGMVQKAGASSGTSARYNRSGLGVRPTPEPRLAPPETGVSCTILRRGDGGIESEVHGKRGRDIYFMGIIDILQEYNARKHGETFFKSLAHDRAEISCVDPHTYCQRFNDFLERHTN